MRLAPTIRRRHPKVTHLGVTGITADGLTHGVSDASKQGSARSGTFLGMRDALLSVVVLLGVCAGCGKTPAPPAPAATPAPVVNVAKAPVPPTTPASLHLGEPISAPDAKLSDIAAHVADYNGKTFATTGVVTAVCQEMGCWMEIKDDSGQAHIRMHGHSFFVPKSSPGHHARVQATLVPTKEAESDCTEEATKQMGHSVAKLELDATGIELD